MGFADINVYKQSIQEPIQESGILEFITSPVGITLMIILAGGAMGVVVVVVKKKKGRKSYISEDLPKKSQLIEEPLLEDYPKKELEIEEKLAILTITKSCINDLMTSFIGFEENFEEVYDFIINSCLNEDILSLKSYKDSIR